MMEAMANPRKIEDITKPHHKNRNKPSLAETHPDIASEWHYKKNCGWKPQDFSKGSNVKAWWKCSEGHIWQALIYTRTGRGNGCFKCNVGFVDLTEFPEVMKFFDRKKNKGIDPRDAKADTLIHWRCKKGDDHKWRKAFVKNHFDRFCPFCNNRKISKTNCLATLYPELAKEFHKTKNGKATPKTVIAATNQSFWWQCKTCSHAWEAELQNRIINKTGCPKCWEKRRIVLFRQRGERLRESRYKKKTN